LVEPIPDKTAAKISLSGKRFPNVAFLWPRDCK
jgi:hypothetical protein